MTKLLQKRKTNVSFILQILGLIHKISLKCFAEVFLLLLEYFYLSIFTVKRIYEQQQKNNPRIARTPSSEFIL